MYTKVVLLTALLVAAMASAEKKSYQGFQVLETEKLSHLSAKFLRDVESTTTQFDFWRTAQPGYTAKVMSSPEHLEELKGILDSNDIKYQVFIADVEKLMETSSVPAPKKTSKNPRYSMDWNDYYGQAEFNEFIDELAANYDYVNTVSIGQSIEGRDMRVIQIAKAGAGAMNVWIEAGIHAREWISPAVATYIISELVENYDAHPEYVDNFNIHVLPSANPDGYEYSRSDDRFWRKNRGDHNSALGCKGVDLNRNWGFHFGESGVSSDKCSDVYNGPEAFSEIESVNSRDYFLNLDPVPVLSVCLHSAAELWLYPYGYAYNSYPDNVDEVIEMGEAATDALNAVHGQTFECINSADLYPAAGASDDWYASKGSRFVYTPELRDNGYGFLLPPSLIIPSGEETFAAFAEMFDRILAEKKQ